MSRRTDGRSLFIVLAVFSVAMILVGSNNQRHGERIMTVRIEGVSEEQMAAEIVSISRMIDGIESLIVNPRCRICTFRYQADRLDVAALNEQFAQFGIKITPINPVDLEQVQTENNQELISIKLTPANQP